MEEEDVFFFPVDFVPLCPAEDEGDFCFCFLSPDENSFVAGDFDVDVCFEVSAFPLPPNSAFTLIISPLPRARPPRLLFFFELFEEEEEEEDTRDEEENSQPSWKLLFSTRFEGALFPLNGSTGTPPNSIGDDDDDDDDDAYMMFLYFSVLCVYVMTLFLFGATEKRERERERERERATTQDTRKVVPKEKKNPKNECDLKNRVYENPGFLKLILRLEILIPHPRNKEREREREREREIKN